MNAIYFADYLLTLWPFSLPELRHYQSSWRPFELPPFFENIRKRVVKSPKIYFTDTGFVAFLLGIHTEEQALRNPFFQPAACRKFLGSVDLAKLLLKGQGSIRGDLLIAARLDYFQQLKKTPNPKLIWGFLTGDLPNVYRMNLWHITIRNYDRFMVEAGKKRRFGGKVKCRRASCRTHPK